MHYNGMHSCTAQWHAQVCIALHYHSMQKYAVLCIQALQNSMHKYALQCTTIVSSAAVCIQARSDGNPVYRSAPIASDDQNGALVMRMSNVQVILLTQAYQLHQCNTPKPRKKTEKNLTSFILVQLVISKPSIRN